jgi:hypothetical protein
MLNIARALYATHVECKDDENAKAKKPRERMGDFCRALKTTLDNSSMGNGWHILMGEQLGFAAKKRNGTMCTFKIDKMLIVAWRSPGIERPEPEEEEEKKEEGEKPVGKSLAKFKVNEPEGEIEEGSEIERTVNTIRSTLQGLPAADAEDVAILAKAVRKRLTEELGTIWHVAAGTEFVCEPAAACRNLVHVSTGKSHIVCFQHEQVDPQMVDWHKIMTALPYLLLVIFLFGFMTLHNVCPDDVDVTNSPFKQSLRRRFCGDQWENRLHVLGGGAIILLMISKKADMFLPGLAGNKKNV